jgi:hypothetical protein
MPFNVLSWCIPLYFLFFLCTKGFIVLFFVISVYMILVYCQILVCCVLSVLFFVFLFSFREEGRDVDTIYVHDNCNKAGSPLGGH